MADGFLLLVRVDCRLRLSRCLLVFRLELLLLRLEFLLVVVVEKGHGLYGITVRKA